MVKDLKANNLMVGYARVNATPMLGIRMRGYYRTRRAEAILTPAHAEAIKLLRGMLGRLPVETAVRELNSMLEKAPTNEELLPRIKVWAESMKG